MSNPADHSFFYDPKTGHYDPPRTEMSALERLHVKENEIARLMAENIRLRAAIVRIDAINDSPACFNSEINSVCDAILRGAKP